MSVLFGLLTSDPNLLRCELRRLEGQVSLRSEVEANAVGVGTYAQEDVLLQHFSNDKELTLSALASQQESEALVFYAGRLPLGLSREDDAQPLRARRWLFAQVGTVKDFVKHRSALLARLPESLVRGVLGNTVAEVCFALFLKHLRGLGRGNGMRQEGRRAALALRGATQELESQEREAALSLVVTNGRVLAAARSGGQPLYYTRLEGTDRCDVCGITPSTSDSQPIVRAHRRRKIVAVASHLKRAHGWRELPSGGILAVEADLELSERSAGSVWTV